MLKRAMGGFAALAALGRAGYLHEDIADSSPWPAIIKRNSAGRAEDIHGSVSCELIGKDVTLARVELDDLFGDPDFLDRTVYPCGCKLEFIGEQEETWLASVAEHAGVLSVVDNIDLAGDYRGWENIGRLRMLLDDIETHPLGQVPHVPGLDGHVAARLDQLVNVDLPAAVDRLASQPIGGVDNDVVAAAQHGIVEQLSGPRTVHRHDQYLSGCSPEIVKAVTVAGLAVHPIYAESPSGQHGRPGVARVFGAQYGDRPDTFQERARAHARDLAEQLFGMPDQLVVWRPDYDLVAASLDGTWRGAEEVCTVAAGRFGLSGSFTGPDGEHRVVLAVPAATAVLLLAQRQTWAAGPVRPGVDVGVIAAAAAFRFRNQQLNIDLATACDTLSIAA